MPGDMAGQSLRLWLLAQASSLGISGSPKRSAESRCKCICSNQYFLASTSVQACNIYNPLMQAETANTDT
jgi:hypothetical protein